ncbi:MAG TPA: type II toxin-antitoxin system VapC family toxin [Pyrinomonadaceae bacterium]|nr:type II toxin-antitoxin system VapC family toxin [Pyrinomonadaceae bacterium]
MSPTNNPDALVTDANIIISVCSKEPTAATVKNVLKTRANNGWEFYAPNIIVAEVLYIFCRKLQNNLLTPRSYEEAIENFQDQMKVIQTPADAQYIKRAKEIQNGYGCSRSADSLYLALAEDLAKTRTVELLTFDKGMINQAAKNAPTVTVKVL